MNMTPEYEQYCIEQAEAWLAKVRKLVDMAARLEDSATAQLAAADNLKGIDYSAIRVQTSPTADAIPNAIIKHEQMGATFKELSESATATVKEASKALASMDDPTEATCLQLYYIDDGENNRPAESWEYVCVKMHYTYDGMMKLRRRAMLHAYAVMPHTERDPTYRADAGS